MRPSLTRSADGAITVPVLLLADCVGPQSAVDPAGPAAASIHHLGLVLWIGAALVTALMLMPFLRRRERQVNRRLFLWGGGVALPALTLSALVPYVMTVGGQMRAPQRRGKRVARARWKARRALAAIG